MTTPENHEENMNINNNDDNLHEAKPLTGLYEDWFLEYASYVILERAIPKYDDGLKPVQRRIFHAMKEMDDGRFHKVANIIGQTMQFHPHGDAAIGDALVNIGQKDLMVDTQGNWGDVRTGDRAAAARYIESRLSKFALDIAFNKEITHWQASYDGRKNEPVQLPIKFPLLLAQGVEGIAVGLSTKIMPHNFIELIKASISILNEKPFKINPDFQTGGTADFTLYNQGKKGGKVRLRSKIDVIDKKTLAIQNVPYSVTTTGLIDSILKANDNGKIKIRKVEDNTAEHVEILVHLTQGISPEVTIDALYAFTQCEISISPNCCVIIDNRPEFISVSKLLKLSTDNTVDLLRQELELLQKNLSEKWHLSSLEKLFIENRIYRDIEECETWDAVIQTIHNGLNPYKEILKREVTDDDIVKLTEIKIKRISKFDSFKADELITGLEADLEEVANNLAHL
ncbi:MAG: DNA gyrase/topoisomerase IV subunit A, partial [Candidatus Marinimicrobia bacterium]|nr:DNA gyrase/topoisomerase IV subunit A [Candidatus Neomarinimicrobiota bacterium]